MATTPPTDQARRRQKLALAILGAALGLLIAAFGIYRAVLADQVLGSVTVGDVELGGLTRPDAVTALEEYEQELLATNGRFLIDGSQVFLQGGDVNFDLDEPALADRAIEHGRTGNVLSQFGWFFGNVFSTTPLPPQATIDEALLEEVLLAWQERTGIEAPSEGAVVVNGTNPEAQYPEAGRQIDRTVAVELVTDELKAIDQASTELPVVAASPVLTAADVDMAVVEAELMLSAPIELISEDEELSVIFGIGQLARAFRSEFVETPAPHLQLSFDLGVVEELLKPIRTELEAAPVDARFRIKDEKVTVVPGRKGTLLTAASVKANLETAAHGSARSGLLPFEEGADPETTTEELEALNITHLVSRFTTYHDCCAPRVKNIHIFADEVDGAIVLPGAELSLNELVGRRTKEEGYVLAPTIVRGELIDTIGGGVSQFATTFYNAVFWGGYEDVSHKPHSFYITRYPEGVEATISWPEPHLIFRNNRDSGILIKTSYTETSITVSFYGNNDGRTIKGSHRNGESSIRVTEKGGDHARRIKLKRSDRYNEKKPPKTEYRPNPDLDVDQKVRLQGSMDGWSVKVTRTITFPDGQPEEVDSWVVVYRPEQEIMEVHPCKVPGTSVSCPTTTTTPPPTTTSVPPTTI